MSTTRHHLLSPFSSPSPLTITPTDMTGASPGITQLAASLLTDESSTTTTHTGSSVLSSPTTHAHTSTLATGRISKVYEPDDSKHRQTVLISLKRLEEIPEPKPDNTVTSSSLPITNEVAVSPFTDSTEMSSRILHKIDQGVLSTVNQPQLPQTGKAKEVSVVMPAPLVTHENRSKRNTNSIPTTFNLKQFPNSPLTCNTTSSSSQDGSTKIGCNWSHDSMSRDSSSSTASSVLTRSSSVSDNGKLELKKSPEVIICSRHDNATSSKSESKITTPCTLVDEGLKLDHLVDKCYKVLNEVKRHREKAEINWNLENIQSFDNRLQDTATSTVLQLPSKSKSQLKTTTVSQSNTDTRQVKCQMKNNLPQPDIIPKPDTQLLYQYMVTGQPPVLAMPVQPNPPPMVYTGQQQELLSEPVPVVAASSDCTVDVGVQINTDDLKNNEKVVSNSRNKEPKLVLEVLSPIDMDCSNNDGSSNNSSTPNKESIDFSSAGIQTVSTPPNSPLHTPSQSSDYDDYPHTQTIGVQTEEPPPPIQDPSCMPHPPVPMSWVLDETMLNRIYQEALDWTRRELLTRALTGVGDQTKAAKPMAAEPKPLPPESVITEDKLLEQVKRILRNMNNKDTESVEQAQGSRDGDTIGGDEYSFTFDSEGIEGSSVGTIPTPTLSPMPSGPSLVPSVDIPTPQPSPPVKCIKDSTNTTESEASVILDNLATPEMSPIISEPKEVMSTLDTPTVSFTEETTNSKEIDNQSQMNTQQSTPQNLILSLTETTPTSRTTDHTPLSLSESSTDHDTCMSYGERAVKWKMNNMKYDRNLSISEGEVPPEWYMSNQRDKEAPLDLSPLDRKRNPINTCFIVDNSQATSIGEIRNLEITSADSQGKSSEDHNKNTLDDIPSFSDIDSLSMTSIKQRDNTNPSRDSPGYSPGEVASTRQLSQGEAAIVSDTCVTTDESCSRSVNEIRNGIEVINVSSKSRSSLCNGDSSIRISTEPPHDASHDIALPPPIMILDNNDYDITSCSFTLSSISIPN